MNVRRARRYAGLTLEEFAGRIGKSKGWLSMIENGRLRLEKRQEIALIAEVLAVSADTLLGQPVPEIAPGDGSHSLKPLRAVLLDAAIDEPPDMPARPVATLGQLVTEMDGALVGGGRVRGRARPPVGQPTPRAAVDPADRGRVRGARR